MNLLYFIVKPGPTHPRDLMGRYGARIDCVALADGVEVGVFRTPGAEARRLLEAEPNITLLPPLHRPLTAQHAAAFAHVNAREGEIAYDVAERLAEFHKMPWMHPEAHDY